MARLVRRTEPSFGHAHTFDKHNLLNVKPAPTAPLTGKLPRDFQIAFIRSLAQSKARRDHAPAQSKE
jgi:hypothetical protein